MNSQLVDELRTLAADMIPEARSQSAAELFRAKASGIFDAGVLRDMVDLYSPYASVCAPLLERLIEVEGESPELFSWLGRIYFINGDDEAARENLRRAKSMEPEAPAALMLEAMLTPDEKMQKEIYARVLQLDPGNRDAWDNLIRFR